MARVKQHIGGLLALIIALIGTVTATGQVHAQTGCLWWVSSDGVSDYQQVNSDGDGTPLTAMRLGTVNQPITGDGTLDFDGDGTADIFRTVRRADGRYQWQYSNGSTGAWTNLAFASTSPANLRFGDFDGDGKTDVFTATKRADGSYQWWYSAGGRANYQPLAFAVQPLGQLRFGDFDGDGRTDVFSVIPRSDGRLQWVYSAGGVANYQNLAFASTPLANLRLADFDANGHTDVFTLSCS